MIKYIVCLLLYESKLHPSIIEIIFEKSRFSSRMKTLRNLLNIITLQFENPLLEKEYIAFNRRKIFERPWACLLTLILAQTFLLVMDIQICIFQVKIFQLCLIFLTALVIILRKKIQNYIEVVISIIPHVISIIGVVNLGGTIQDLPPSHVFFRAYVLGAIQQLLAIWLFRFKLIILPNILSLGSRLAVLFVLMEARDEGYFIELMSISVLIDAVFLFSIYNRELNERNFFRNASGCKKEVHIPEQQALWKHFSKSILIISPDLKTKMFSNENFDRTFNHRCQTESFQITLDKLYVQKDNFHTHEDVYVLFESNPYLSLYEFLIKSINSKVLNEKPLMTFAVHDQKQDKEKKLFEVKINKAKWQDNDAIIILIDDITIQKDLILLNAANTSKDKIFNTVSHELKTPIHGILAMLVAGMQSTRDPEALNVFDFCKKSTLILLNFVQSLIDLQLIRANKIRLRPSKVHLESLIRDLASLFELHRSQKGISLIYEIDEDVPKYLYTDYDRLNEVLINLVANAIKFTHKGGITIKVKAGPSSHKKTTLFEIKDTGIGMSEKQQQKIFRMCAKLDDGEDNSVHGAGIGLSVSNSIVKLLNQGSHDVGIKCMSEQNKGSTFSFVILNELIPQTEDLSNFLDATEDPDIEARMTPYSKKSPEASRMWENSRSNLSGVSNCYDNEEGVLLKRFQGLRRSSVQRSSSRLLSSGHKIPSHLSSPHLGVPTSPTSPLHSPQEFTQRKEGRLISIVITPPQANSDTKLKLQAQKLTGWVLLVDDNPLNLLVAKKIIGETGCQVKTAINGQDAIEKAKEHVENGLDFFKLVLMDCQMPVMDGYDATRAFRCLMKNGEIPHCKIVALTANDTEEDIQKCRDSGMDDVFSKPLREQTLHKLVDYLKGD